MRKSDSIRLANGIEMMDERNNTGKTRGRPFQKGNPGRPVGARHKTTLAIEAMLDGQHVALTEKAISLALNGDLTALKLCLDRLAPPRRDAPIRVDLPVVEAAADTVGASTVVIAALSKGEITPSEAGSVMAVLSAHLKFIETLDLERRIARLEEFGLRQ